MFKQMQKSPEGLRDRNKAFEAERREAIAAEDAEDLALVKERLAEDGETLPLEEVLKEMDGHAHWCHAKVRSSTVNECNCQSEGQR